MPEESYPDGYQFFQRAQMLSNDETVRLVSLFARVGVSKLRLTGGEPLLRKDIADLLARLGRIDGIDDIAMSTNGVLLPRFATALREAGLDRITVSLDSTDPETFLRMSGGRGSLDEAVTLYHFGPAHTDGDAIVYFAHGRVAHFGDLYHGFAELSVGEDMVGLARTLGAMLGRLPTDAVLVTGHGTVQDVADLRRYHTMLSDAIAHVRAQVDRGTTLEQVQARGLPEPWTGLWQGDPEWLAAWLAEIHRTLTGQG